MRPSRYMVSRDFWEIGCLVGAFTSLAPNQSAITSSNQAELVVWVIAFCFVGLSAITLALCKFHEGILLKRAPPRSLPFQIPT